MTRDKAKMAAMPGVETTTSPATFDLRSFDSEGDERAVFFGDLATVARAGGFLYLVGHGISERLTRSMVGHVQRLFAPPVRDKLAATMVNSLHFRGYTRPRFEYSRGEQDWREQVDIGDARSLVIHPASTTHQQLDREERLAAGAAPSYVPLSIGIERAENMTGDLALILDAAGGATSAATQQKAA